MPETTPPTRRRWFRFGLRSLLVFTALVSLLMGWIAKERRQSAREREIATRLKALGWAVELEGPYFSRLDRRKDPPWWNRTTRHLLGDRITQLTGYRARTKDLSPLSELKSLRVFATWNTEACDLTQLSKLKTLRHLVITDCVLHDLSPIAGLENLETLRVSGTRVDDLAPLVRLGNLKTLDVEGTKIIDLTPLAGIVTLQELRMSNTQVRDLTPLAGLNNLLKLSLAETHVSDLTPLAGLNQLSELRVSGPNVTYKQFDALKEALPNCKIEGLFP